MAYQRVTSTDPFSSGVTAATTVINAIEAGLEAAETTISSHTTSITTNTTSIALEQSGYFADVMKTLDDGLQSCAIQVVTDSTGNGSLRWPYLLGQSLAALYPAWTVEHRNWDGTSDYAAPTRLQTGSAGERYVDFIGTTTATGTNGTSTITVASTAGLVGGAAQTVRGTGIATGATISSVNTSTNVVTLSAANTADVSGNVTFTNYTRTYSGTGDGTTAWTTAIDVRAKLQPSYGWVDASGSDYVLVSKWSVAPTLSMYFAVDNAGRPYVRWSQDGTTNNLTQSTAIVPFTGTTIGWVRATIETNNGGSMLVKFYTSTDNVTWTQLGTTVTLASQTSLFTSSAEKWQIGARSVTAASGRGRIYEVEVRSGIGGALMLPRYPELWDEVASSGYNGTVAGAPVLTINAGAWSGAAQAQLTGAYANALCPNAYDTKIVILSCSHNDGITRNRAYWAAWDTWVTAQAARLLEFPLVYMTQNPRTSPATLIQQHTLRLADGRKWAHSHAYPVIDIYKAFTSSSLGLASLTNVDGIHPSDAAGSPLWRDTVLAYFTNRK